MLLSLLAPALLTTGVRAESGQLCFQPNGEFKILIVADTQDAVKPQKETLLMLERSLDTAKPDLVVLLGDIIHGNDIKTEKSAKAAIDAIIAPIEQRKLPFAIVFGNHDDNGGVSKETQMALYQTHPGCLSIDGEELSGCGNYNLPIYDSEGDKLLFNLWFFDSGSYDTEREDAYAYVEQDQLDWYACQSEALRKQNGGESVPSFAFQHIIVPEIYDMLLEVPKATAGAVRGHGSHNDSYYVINPEYIFDGSMGEAPCPPEFNSGELYAWTKQGDVIAAFFGHDHKNDFSGSYKGIDLVATPGTGFYIYGNGDEHGTRSVTLKQSDLKSYETELLYYKDLVGAPPFGIKATRGARYELPVALGIVGVIVLTAGISLLCVKHRRKAKQKK